MGACDGDGWNNVPFLRFLVLSALKERLHPDAVYCLVGTESGGQVTFLRVSEVPQVGDKVLVTREHLPFPASFLPADGIYKVVSRGKDVSFSEIIVYPCFLIKPAVY